MVRKGVNKPDHLIQIIYSAASIDSFPCTKEIVLVQPFVMLNRWLSLGVCSSFFVINDLRLEPRCVLDHRSALPELLDAYGDRLLSYCSCLLRNRENPQIAVRDALVVATAQVGGWFAMNGSACGSTHWPVRNVSGARRLRPEMPTSRLPSRTRMTPIRD